MMRPLLVAALVLVAGQALADGPYNDNATSLWFKSLTIANPNGGVDIGCCDKSDCHETKSLYQDGGWWAESRLHPGEWVRVPAANVLKGPNPLENAVLCEAVGGLPAFRTETVPSGIAEWLYCFLPPPLGF